MLSVRQRHAAADRNGLNGQARGHPQDRGKQKGTKNKRTIARELSVRERCDARGYDPISAMVEIASDPAMDPSLRADMHKAVAPYLYPKLASTELKGSTTHPIVVKVSLD